MPDERMNASDFPKEVLSLFDKERANGWEIGLEIRDNPHSGLGPQPHKWFLGIEEHHLGGRPIHEMRPDQGRFP